jgi:hypothetical protein
VVHFSVACPYIDPDQGRLNQSLIISPLWSLGDCYD